MNLITVWLSAAGFTVIAAMRVMDPVLPVVARDFGLTIGNAGVVVTAFALPYGLFQLIYGPLGDRVGKLKVIASMLAVSAVFTGASALAPGVEALAVMRFLTGMTAAAVVPLSLAYIADNVAYAGRQTAIGRYLIGLIFGQIVGGSLGGVFAEYFGWRALFVVFAVVTGMISVGLWRIARTRREELPPVPSNGRRMLEPYLALLKRREPRAVILAVAAEGLLFFGGFTFIGAYLHAEFGLSFAYIGLILAGFGFGGLIYSSAVRRIVETLGERGMLTTGGLLMAVCYLSLAAAPDWRWCIPLVIALGFGFIMMHNTLQTLATELAPDTRGTAVSLFAFSLFMGQGVGVALLGHIIDGAGYGPAFAVSGMGLALLGFWFRTRVD
jgi:predicted MFS family arabinose efflux permease